jgi:hypothetical protein
MGPSDPATGLFSPPPGNVVCMRRGPATMRSPSEQSCRPMHMLPEEAYGFVPSTSE